MASRRSVKYHCVPTTNVPNGVKLSDRVTRDLNMFAAIGTGLTLWVRNIPLLSALVLTVWLPGNVVLNWIAWQSQTESLTWSDFWLPMGIDSIFGPISVVALVYALDRRWQARQVGYFESMRVGLRFWVQLFTTSLVADTLIGLGCLLFIIPGIILALRYALIGMAVVFEERSGDSARLRSTDLMQGRMWAVLCIVSVSGGLLIALAVGLYVPLDLAYESTTMTDPQYYVLATGIDCLIDILSVPILAMLFCIYVQASGRVRLQDIQNDPIDLTSTHLPLPLDDGNPYSPPRTS